MASQHREAENNLITLKSLGGGVLKSVFMQVQGCFHGKTSTEKVREFVRNIFKCGQMHLVLRSLSTDSMATSQTYMQECSYMINEKSMTHDKMHVFLLVLLP